MVNLLSLILDRTIEQNSNFIEISDSKAFEVSLEESLFPEYLSFNQLKTMSNQGEKISLNLGVVNYHEVFDGEFDGDFTKTGHGHISLEEDKGITISLKDEKFSMHYSIPYELNGDLK